METTNDELNLDELDQIDAQAENKLKVKNRFQQLSEKVKTEAQEKEKALAEAKASAERVAQLEKEAAFHKNLTQLSSKYPEALNYQDQILERVNKGYDQEDAILSVLAKEGKLASQPAPAPKMENIAGGSAITNVVGEDKSISDLSAAEKLNALAELEKSGELTKILRPQSR